MKINDVKNETAKFLGVESSELDYITEELILVYFSDESSEDSFELGVSDTEMKDSKSENLLSYGRYGNSLVTRGNKVSYKRNDRGTTNYGCGTNNWTWTSKPGDTFTPLGKCSNGKREYLLKRP
jgi:hypothetical protein